MCVAGGDGVVGNVDVDCIGIVGSGVDCFDGAVVVKEEKVLVVCRDFSTNP